MVGRKIFLTKNAETTKIGQNTRHCTENQKKGEENISKQFCNHIFFASVGFADNHS